MTSGRLTAAVAALGLTCGLAVAQQPVKAPEPTVPEVFTLMGQYVRVAYNNQGFASLGYRAAQLSVGEEWMLLEVGLTMRDKQKAFTLKREHLSIQTPDGKRIALASQPEYQKADLRALNMRTRAIRDSINYFPMGVTRPCSIQFFAELGGPGPRVAFDQVELSDDRGCLGRLYFQVPGGIQVGQHWLHVAFPDGEVQVPFRILTKDEAKEFEKSWQDIKKQHDESLK